MQVFHKVTKNDFQHSENDCHLRVTISSLERCAIAWTQKLIELVSASISVAPKLVLLQNII